VKKKVTLQTIADALSVSKVAVFKALNNQKGVSDSLRKRIQEYAMAVGYRTQVIAKEVKNRKFLFFVNQEFFLSLSEQYYSTIFYFLSAECNKTNNLLQIAYLEPENTIDKIKKAISSYRPDGIFFAGEVKNEIIEYMQKISIPTVYIDYYSPLFECNYVYQDNYHLSYIVTNYLINKGHSKIGFVGNIHSTSAIADRYFGYLKALTENKITQNPMWHINVNIEKSSDIIELDLKEYPTAFVCHCDAAARWLYTALATKALRVPDDVSVIGFDNTELCENLIPKLTSAGPKKDQYAKKAFSLMMNALSTSGKPQQIKINAELIIRSSVP
jgi:LacI family transcriptional regulator